MKAKDLARILQTNPEAEVFIGGESIPQDIHRVEMQAADGLIDFVILKTN